MSISSIFEIILIIVAFLGTAAFWEFVAWWMHKYIMHGTGWFLHRDHHVTSGRRVQLNDTYALIFATCSFLLIYNGLKYGWKPVAASGFGIATYGLGYVIFHDVIFHRHIKGIKTKPKSTYLKRIIDNHRVHHGVVTKDGATSFGFLWAPKPAEKPSGHIPKSMQEN